MEKFIGVYCVVVILMFVVYDVMVVVMFLEKVLGWRL